MENMHYDFAESLSGDLFIMQHVDASESVASSTEPDDDEADDETDSDGDEEPSLDSDVVHSPLPTDNGGKPKS